MIDCLNPRKAAIIGCGFVGAASAFTLMQSKLFSEIVLIDSNFDKADGEAKDISHGIPFAGQMKIYAGDYADISNASIAIVTAGANQRPNETMVGFDTAGGEWYLPNRWIPHCALALTRDDGETAFCRASELVLNEFTKVVGEFTKKGLVRSTFPVEEIFTVNLGGGTDNTLYMKWGRKGFDGDLEGE